ncbi:methyltransferase type 11 [Mesorhizobium hawassense]|uniref:Methyltransferase type 11 n=1 Tax=Mesorhizobium hawassense TaxID=1209954 RepID=A0A330HW06_9HYPH|nr:methyltransferase domain-containing protein [Mesorhizobium hawassense]RAZ91174.1 methyltransferase type 11 [Mesorhizobium hawassense]
MDLQEPVRLLPSALKIEPFLVIERSSTFQGVVHIAGYVFCEASPVVAMRLTLTDGRRLAVSQMGLPSPDLARRHGRAAASCRFEERFFVGLEYADMLNAAVEVVLADGSSHARPLAAADPNDTVLPLVDRFFQEVRSRPSGRLLEIGSRNRTGAMWRTAVPETWRYTGFDILDGENVDIVGDAHEASRFLPRQAFDAVMSFAVFEHLLMPWKAVIEMNRVLRAGAIGIILAPQTWSLHEEPCDYFRFSSHAWKALLNPATGFEIIDAVDGSRAYIVARVHNVATAFGEVHTGALMSAVLFRKTGETNLDWPVSMRDIASDLYPM